MTYAVTKVRPKHLATSHTNPMYLVRGAGAGVGKGQE